jgi:hypothetical protein
MDPSQPHSKSKTVIFIKRQALFSPLFRDGTEGYADLRRPNRAGDVVRSQRATSTEVADELMADGRGWTSLSSKELLPGCSVAVACTSAVSSSYLG